MTAPTHSEIVAKAVEGTLMGALFGEDQREWLEDQETLSTTLAEVHNSGQFDLLSLFVPKAFEPFSGYPLYDGQQLFRALIGKLQAPASALLSAVDVVISAGISDPSTYYPAAELSEWCAGDPSRPLELLGLIEQGFPNANRYLVAVITKGAQVDPVFFRDRAYGFLASGTQEDRVAAIYALAQLQDQSQTDIDRLAAAFENTLRIETDDSTRAAVLRAAVDKLKVVPSSSLQAFSDIAATASGQPGVHVQAACAHAISFDAVHLSPALIDALLLAMSTCDLRHKGSLRLVDYALKRLVDVGEVLRVRRFVERLVRESEDFGFRSLESLSRGLLDRGGHDLEDWVIAWLRSGDIYLCDQLGSELFQAGNETFSFSTDFGRFALTEAEYGFLARKAIGTFFMRPTIMASLLVSLLRSAPQDASTEIEALLVDPILVNYSGSAGEFLQTIADDPSDKAGSAARCALSQLSEYIQGLQSIGQVVELHPSERERQLEWQHHSDLMNAVMREARKRSIFASLVTEKILLHGTGSVSWVSGGGMEPRRLETTLASIGHSMEIPRAEVLDPLGLEYLLFQFRKEEPPQ